MTTTDDTVPFLDLGAMHDEIRPQLDAAWRDVTASGAFVGGPALEAFERDWAAYCGSRHAVGLANGTDALHLVLRALGIGPGDEVVVPANTFVATVEAVMLAGATPRFVDVDSDTLLMTPATIEPALGHRTAAIVVVHLYGGMPDMDAMVALASSAGVALVEDAAQAHGATLRGRAAGSFGHAGCFSFYPGKNLGAFGDGGAVVTDDPALAQRLRSLGDHGRDPGDKFRHTDLGTNSRLDGLQAAVLGHKLTRLDAWNAARRRVMAAYRAGLWRARPVEVLDEVDSVHHLAVVRVPERDAVRAALAAHGVQTGIHYPVPCHLQPPYERFATEPLPVVESAANRILSLPMYPHLSERQVARVCDAVDTAVAGVGGEVLVGTRDGR